LNKVPGSALPEGKAPSHFMGEKDEKGALPA
jgi:hypothetical protein